MFLDFEFKSIFLLTRVWYLVATSRQYNTMMTLYDKDHYGNDEVYDIPLQKGLFDLRPYLGNELGNGASSFTIDKGTCAELYKVFPPTKILCQDWFYGIDFHHQYALGDRLDFDNKVLVVTPCEIETKLLRCPDYHFVDRMTWDDSKGLRSGVELRCVSARAKNDKVVMRSHGAGRLRQRAECPNSVLKGFNQKTSERQERVLNLFHWSCNSNDEKWTDTEEITDIYFTDVYTGSTSSCPANQAMVGIEIDIEKNSNYVKYIEPICAGMISPFEVCIPTDRWVTIFTCDGTEATHEFECSKAMGVGRENKTTLSEEESWEKELSYGFGGGVDVNAKSLSAGFSANVGFSNKTGYNWKNTTESIFYDWVTITVHVTVPPGCVTSVEQIVGQCAWLEIKTHDYERKDNCKPGVVAPRREKVYVEGKGWYL